MIRLRGMWTGLVLGSAIISRQSLAQSSVSLTHVVTVTVPPRVKAQVTSFAPAAQTATRVSSIQPATNGLVITVNATQAWTLSIGSAVGKSTQWSHDSASGFAKVDTTDAMVASGTISHVPTSAAVFFRNASAVASSDTKGSEGSEPITLTVAAQ
ncbi:MAG TPA: hypothetical protein VF387_05170 [Gemmatimonadaceae bacterium]